MSKLIDNAFRLSFGVFFMALLASIYFMTTHSTAYHQMLIIGGLASSIVVVCSIYEIATAKEISRREKLMWIVAFLFINVLAALLYYVIRRKQIIRAHSIVTH